jgi:hypothetical protein
MNATPKVGVHLGIVKLHPLHSPAFVKMCFTSKHTFDFMGPCTSHLVTNPMLRLQHKHKELATISYVLFIPQYRLL